MNCIVSPSLLAADFGKLQSDIELINQSQADWFHCDIMDGEFVPNISFGFPVMEAIKKHAQKPLDVHLMIVNPDKFINEFRDLGAHMLTVHYEACPHLHRTIERIKAAGMKAGVALNPHTPVSLLQDIIPELDLTLIMTVNPGFGGQKFIEQSYAKVKRLKSLITETNSQSLIQVDGGVVGSNAQPLLDCGVDVLVAGSYVFKSDDPIQTIAELKALRYSI